MPVKILVTGFGAFPGARSNPSAALVQNLAKNHAARLARLGIALHVRLLPVVFDSVSAQLDSISEAICPHAILHIGLASRRRHVSIELVARNKVSLLRVDAARNLPRSATIQPGGANRKTTLPHRAIFHAIQASGIQTRLSNDAGDYVCNQTLYLSLARSSVPAGFIHIPRLAACHRRKTSNRRPLPRLPALTLAFASVLAEIGKQARNSALQ